MTLNNRFKVPFKSSKNAASKNTIKLDRPLRQWVNYTADQMVPLFIKESDLNDRYRQGVLFDFFLLWLL